MVLSIFTSVSLKNHLFIFNSIEKFNWDFNFSHHLFCYRDNDFNSVWTGEFLPHKQTNFK